MAKAYIALGSNLKKPERYNFNVAFQARLRAIASILSY
jgi:7,8-dihydro-6-hydroxymethylpterin-pyrophosphokinase